MDLLALTWNNHKKTFFSSISACRSNGQYTDVTLVCDGEYYPVHKLVLSSSSDYFKDIFDKITQPNLAVCLKEVKPAELEALLNYMYLGRAEVKHANIAELMKAAEYLMIKGLFTSDVKEEKGDRSDADSTNGSSDSVEDKTYKPSTSGSRINDDSHIPSLRKRKHESPGRDAQSNKKQREGSSDESVKDTKLNKNSGIALPRIKMDIKSPVQSIKKKNRDGAGPSGQKGILMNYLESGKASQMPSSSADKTLDDDSYIPDESADQWEDIENSVSADRDKDEDLKDEYGGYEEMEKNQCKTCRLILSNKANLNRHIRNVHDKHTGKAFRKVNDKHSGKAFRNVHDKQSGKSFVCKLCSAKFNTVQSYGGHMNSHKYKKISHFIGAKSKKKVKKGKSKTAYTCPLCPEKVYLYQSGLCYHMRNTHGSENPTKDFHELTNKKLSLLNPLVIIKTEPGTEDQTESYDPAVVLCRCSSCSEFFESRDNFLEHVKTCCPSAHNSLQGDKAQTIRKCSSCMKYLSANNFERHITLVCPSAYNILERSNSIKSEALYVVDSNGDAECISDSEEPISTDQNSPDTLALQDCGADVLNNDHSPSQNVPSANYNEPTNLTDESVFHLVETTKSTEIIEEAMAEEPELVDVVESVFHSVETTKSTEINEEAMTDEPELVDVVDQEIDEEAKI